MYPIRPCLTQEILKYFMCVAYTLRYLLVPLSWLLSTRQSFIIHG